MNSRIDRRFSAYSGHMPRSVGLPRLKIGTAYLTCPRVIGWSWRVVTTENIGCPALENDEMNCRLARIAEDLTVSSAGLQLCPSAEA
jgi:hypothetical protein